MNKYCFNSLIDLLCVKCTSKILYLYAVLFLHVCVLFKQRFFPRLINLRYFCSVKFGFAKRKFHRKLESIQNSRRHTLLRFFPRDLWKDPTLPVQRAHIRALHYIAESLHNYFISERYITRLRRFLLGTSRSHIFLEFPASDPSDAGCRRDAKDNKFSEINCTLFSGTAVQKLCRYKKVVVKIFEIHRSALNLETFVSFAI